MLPSELPQHSEQELAKLPHDFAALVNARVRVRRGGEPAAEGKCVVYWMQRAQRALDNPALDLAIDLGNLLRLPVVVYFSVIETYPHANHRHYAFMGQGFADCAEDCARRNVGFVLQRPPNNRVEAFLSEVGAAIVVGDENPLRVPRKWRDSLAHRLKVPFLTVDADVVVPSRLLEKAQYAAYVARPRLEKMREQWLLPCSNRKAETAWHAPRGLESYSPKLDISDGWRKLDRSVGPVEDYVGGTHAATQRLDWFMKHAFAGYAESRGEPSTDGSSKLSAYLHFGHISPLTIALAAQKAVHSGKGSAEDLKSLFNELLIWRELAVNFVTYNEHYDSWECADDWARQTLREHADDKRETLYTLKQLREAQTHDDMWNASQMQMVNTGWMHNRMRMYWAKKIFEWSPNVATAFEHAVILNDTYEMDGRDPNGYAGIAWSMVGKFDRPWFERPVFGKIRYMSRESTGRKFDSAKYIAQQGAEAQAALGF